jgi:hypothetical protein
MKHIAFIFTDGDAWTSTAIRVQTWGDVNHAAFEFVEDNVIVQIQNPKVIFAAPGYLLNTSKKAYRFVLEVDDALYAAAYAFAEKEMVGKAYDKVSVARFLIPLRRVLGRLTPTKRWASETWFCSEGTQVLSEIVGKKLVRKEPARCSPQDLFESIRLESEEVVLYQEYEKGELLYSGLYLAKK